MVSLAKGALSRQDFSFILLLASYAGHSHLLFQALMPKRHLQGWFYQSHSRSHDHLLLVWICSGLLWLRWSVFSLFVFLLGDLFVDDGLFADGHEPLGYEPGSQGRRYSMKLAPDCTWTLFCNPIHLSIPSWLYWSFCICEKGLLGLCLSCKLVPIIWTILRFFLEYQAAACPLQTNLDEVFHFDPCLDWILH